MKAQSVISSVLAVTAWQFVSQAQETGKSGTGDGFPARVRKVEEIKFKHSTFTFVRIKYSGVRVDRRTWAIDYPDADVNFAAQFQKETGLKVDTNGMVLELTDPKLKQQPFIYIAEGGQMHLNPEEVKGLREYLLGGGFLMVDDFWGESEWSALAAQFHQVFPDREPVDLQLDHAIFRCYYEMREKPQVPNVGLGIRSQSSGVTWEREDAREAHYRGLFDDSGRLMAVFCHNTDLGDGWERQVESEYYYREFSLKKAYPMGINIVVHALSH
ncbi:MAG TPA: DUF4159 domain-containing protein [Verrucomicrobiae bacterium]|nr:DUF4159 domain-containing protein [Verrucomicrobiae bacterium]